MQNGWYKYFSDGTVEKGLDSDGAASWSRGRLDGMNGVTISHNNIMMNLFGPGEYWQSDDFESSMNTGKTRLVTRRLQKRIEDGRWLTLELNVDTGEKHRYYSKDRL